MSQEPNQGIGATTQSKTGLWAGISAFTIWGFLPLFWNLLHGVPAQEIIAHRIVWSVFFLIPVIVYTKAWPEIVAALRNPAVAFRCFVSGVFVAGNWYLYVWAVNSGHVLETSLGYYINPLLNIGAGALFFRERPNGLQLCAIALATFGVIIMIVGYGQVPWVGLGLGTSFLLYGIMKKTIKVNALAGLYIETGMLVPFTVAWLLWQEFHGQASFGHIAAMDSCLLVLAGLVTSVPLLCFCYAARTLRLTTIGLLQYIGPTLAFMQGVFIFHEPITFAHLCTFGCIWVALAIYSYDSWRALRRIESPKRL